MLTYERVLRDRIPAQQLFDVAKVQGKTGRQRTQKAHLLELANLAMGERGW